MFTLHKGHDQERDIKGGIIDPVVEVGKDIEDIVLEAGINVCYISYYSILYCNVMYCGNKAW